MAYIGQGIKQGTFKVLDTSGNTYNGSNTTFSLGTQVGSAAQLLVSHDGVIQKAGTDYTLATGGTQITFSTAPASGASIFIVEISGAVGGTVTPSDTSVTADKLNSALLTGLTDIGAGIADADLFLIDDGGGGTLRKVAASRLSTYISPSSATDSFTITGSTPTLTIGDAGAEDTKIVFDGNAQDYHIGLDDSSDDLVIGLGSTLGTTSYLNFDEGGKLSTGGETAPDISNGGLCLNSGANDENHISLKSSDIAHGMTNEAETDTFAEFSKQSGSEGGLQIRSYAESRTEEWYEMNCQANSDIQETKAGNAKGAFSMIASKKSGAGTTTVNSNGNLLTLASYTNTEFIFEANGNFHADSGSTTFDAYEDAQLARAFDLSHGRGVIESKFDKFVQYNHEKLAELKLVGRDEDGKPNSMLNVTGLQRLHNGAIWQQYEKHNQLLEAVYDLAKEAVGEEKANAILEKHEVKRLQ